MAPIQQAKRAGCPEPRARALGVALAAIAGEVERDEGVGRPPQLAQDVTAEQRDALRVRVERDQGRASFAQLEGAREPTSEPQLVRRLRVGAGRPVVSRAFEVPRPKQRVALVVMCSSGEVEGAT